MIRQLPTRYSPRIDTGLIGAGLTTTGVGLTTTGVGFTTIGLTTIGVGLTITGYTGE